MTTLNAHVQKLSLTPRLLREEFPLSTYGQQFVSDSRNEIIRILKGESPKLLVIVGPCSIHDYASAKEYAELLKKSTDYLSDQLLIVMRVYFEKARTSTSWKGFITDPFLNGDYQVELGLRKARKLLCDINKIGLPIATEFLDPIIPVYLYDLISWSAIGARTTTSPLHRELASALPMPVGFKNTLDGNISMAIDAIKVASRTHAIFSINNDGHPVILKTQGNEYGHVVLRGSHFKPNYEAKDILLTMKLLKNSQGIKRLVVDCSHGNSMKDPLRQKNVLQSVADQIQKGSPGICGIMLESYLLGGKQSLEDQAQLTYGKSITDACLSWEDTLPLLEMLANCQQTLRYSSGCKRSSCSTWTG